ncbi:zinc metallopeptidase [Peptoniphilus sp. KCTC 25270]|uniref:KPN_02809 family neutral zinc metallopeptidase n=1 Tax=Peptoniphilus sp. KCTC 25270 TaxID=2897414 RepID=UPI001E581F51|nr:neutral zinc metallopeptidase [Peptoniphilus sp. KCTC 25270]MCD1147926.1 zinc metallopeptidase [Peptoniphilus sp. KCTC 25270]
MKFQGRRQSRNISRRGSSGGGFPVGGGLGIGGLIIVVLFTLLTGGNLGDIMGSTTQPNRQIEQSENNEQSDKLYEFTSVVLADTEDVWGSLFQNMGREYTPPQTTIYSGAVQSGCGFASSQVGPFYCSADKTVYLDLTFYNDLQNKYGAAGDFAFAYVIAHEVGHHVQQELGILSQVQQIQQRVSQTQANQWNVAMELQADYLAGVVAHHQDAAGYLDPGDIEEAMQATIAVGDDTIQKRAQGHVVPDSFTHGSAAQRKEWYMKGYNAGDLREWDSYTALGLQ